MSAYCTSTDIALEFKSLEIKDGQPITSGLLDNWIGQESAYIDALIGKRYSTPIVQADSPNAYALVQRICIFRVCERVQKKLEVKTGVSNYDSEQKTFVRTPNNDLKDISTGALPLSDAALISSTGAVSSFNVKNSVERVFKTDEQQW